MQNHEGDVKNIFLKKTHHNKNESKIKNNISKGHRTLSTLTQSHRNSVVWHALPPLITNLKKKKKPFFILCFSKVNNTENWA